MTLRTLRPSRPGLLLALGCAAALYAGHASAQTGQPPASDYVAVGLQQVVFFSPSGEPFRTAVGQPYPVMTWFNQADTDHDGKLSRDEFIADAMRFFAELDLNHDGYISSTENTNYENNIAPEILSVDPRIQQPYIRVPDADPDMDTTADADPMAGKYIKQILGAAQYSLIDEPQPILAADANFDFRLSTDEWLAATNQRFTILDRNGDGFITPDELPKTPAQQAIEHAAGKGEPAPKKKGFHLF